MIDRPRGFARDTFGQSGSRGMAIATLLDTPKGQMDFSANAGQVHISHAVLTSFPEEAHGPVVFSDHCQRQAILRVIVNPDGIFVCAEWNQGEVRPENLFPNGPNAGPVLH